MTLLLIFVIIFIIASLYDSGKKKAKYEEKYAYCTPKPTPPPDPIKDLIYQYVYCQTYEQIIAYFQNLDEALESGRGIMVFGKTYYSVDDALLILLLENVAHGATWYNLPGGGTFESVKKRIEDYKEEVLTYRKEKANIGSDLYDERYDNDSLYYTTIPLLERIFLTDVDKIPKTIPREIYFGKPNSSRPVPVEFRKQLGVPSFIDEWENIGEPSNLRERDDSIKREEIKSEYDLKYDEDGELSVSCRYWKLFNPGYILGKRSNCSEIFYICERQAEKKVNSEGFVAIVSATGVEKYFSNSPPLTIREVMKEKNWFNYKFEELKGTYVGRMHDIELDELMSDLIPLLKELEWWQSGDSSQEEYRK